MLSWAVRKVCYSGYVIATISLVLYTVWSMNHTLMTKRDNIEDREDTKRAPHLEIQMIPPRPDVTMQQSSMISFTYSPPFNLTLKGKPLKVAADMWDYLEIREFVKLSDIRTEDLAFVIGASRNHFNQSLDAIASVQHWFPHRHILYYDLELQHLLPEQVRQLKSLCNIEYRRFNFSRFPEHVKDLYSYAFKCLVVQEVLKSHKGVFWMDASIRLQTSDLDSALQYVYRTGGLHVHIHTPHGIYPVTHAAMYDFIPTEVHRLKHIQMYGATSFILYRTREVWENFYKWVILCSLVKECIAPQGSRIECHFHKNRYTKHAKCHRFDQSLMNILLLNWHNHTEIASHKTDNYVLVRRYITHLYKRKLCAENLEKTKSHRS